MIFNSQNGLRPENHLIIKLINILQGTPITHMLAYLDIFVKSSIDIIYMCENNKKTL